MKLFKTGFILFFVLFYVGCQSGGNAPGVSNSEDPSNTTPPPAPPVIPTDGTSSFALVYGSTAQDRQFLADRIAGYQAPGLADVFNQWRRIAGNNVYNSVSEIVQTPAYCFSGFDANHNWLPAVNPSNGQTISPGTYGECVNSNAFVSSSWSYVNSPESIYNAANGTSFNGFISGLKFLNFTNQALVTSTNTDDDGIGLIIASTIDAANVVHTLTALRTQGGYPPLQGWGIVYRQNNSVIRIFDEKSVGGVNKNGSSGDRLGWNGRKTLIKIERNDNMISAYTSNWGTGATTLVLEPTSKIEINLNDSSLGLDIFKGEQYYGYGTISQLGATYSDINFTTPNAEADPSYIFDLLNNTVYNKQASGGYVLVNGMQAYSVIGYPKRVKNTETQKEFRIETASSYTEL